MGVTCRTNYFGYFLIWIINRYQTYKWMNGFSYQMGGSCANRASFVDNNCMIFGVSISVQFMFYHLCFFILWTVNMMHRGGRNNMMCSGGRCYVNRCNICICLFELHQWHGFTSVSIPYVSTYMYINKRVILI
jgi:hypothetical protein